MKILQRRENKNAFTKASTTKKRKDTIDGTEHEEPLVTDNPVIKEPSYFNPFKCGKNILNMIGAKYKLACMVTSKDKYFT